MTTEITCVRVRELLAYDAQTGALTWRVSPRYGIQPGDMAGGRSAVHGYMHVKISRRTYQHHRLIWLFVTGEWPIGQIDHKNGDGCDNRWSNLREGACCEHEGESIGGANQVRRGRATPWGVRYP